MGTKTIPKSLPERSGAFGTPQPGPQGGSGRSGDAPGRPRDAPGTLRGTPGRSRDAPGGSRGAAGTLLGRSGDAREHLPGDQERPQRPFAASSGDRMARGPFFVRFSYVARKRGSAFHLSFSGVSCKSRMLRHAQERTRKTSKKLPFRTRKSSSRKLRGQSELPKTSSDGPVRAAKRS